MAQYKNVKKSKRHNAYEHTHQTININGASTVDKVPTFTGIIVCPSNSSGQHHGCNTSWSMEIAHRGTTTPPFTYASSSCAKYSARSIGVCEYSLSTGTVINETLS